MSLFAEIQNDILGDKPISSILRKARILAHDLKNQDFNNWIEFELNGYEVESAPIPDYRKLRTPIFGDFMGGFTNVLIPLHFFSKEWREKLESPKYMRDGAKTIEDYIVSANNANKDEFQTPLPPSALKNLHNNVYPNMYCLSAWEVTSRQQLVQILETIRDRLQRFTFELSEMYPDYAKTDFDNNPSISSDIIFQVVQKIIFNNPIFVEKEIYMGDNIDIKMGDVSNVSGQLFIGKFNEVFANLNNSGQTELAEALKTLKDAVMASQHIPDEKKKEHVEVINQIGDEAAKEKPNKTLLKVMGDGLFSILKAIPDVAKAVAAVVPFFSH